MDRPGVTGKYITVAAYEAIGTAILVYTIIVSGGDPAAIALTLGSLIIAIAPMTGAHFNPCQATACFYCLEDKDHIKWKTYIVTLLGQFVGAYVGVEISIATLAGT